MKIQQREKGTLPLPVPVITTEDLDVLTRRVESLESLTASLLWLHVARREPRRPE